MNEQLREQIRHPAKYSDELMPIFDQLLPAGNVRILDPFAGTGKLRNIRPECYLLEIEPEWAGIRGAIVGDATEMPFKNGYFDAVCTSPTYGNRMADSFQDRKPEKKYIRNTYRHSLGRKLSANNSGAMQFGDAYKKLHIKAWGEVYRVLRPGGVFVLNISDHVRKGVVVPVTDWHISCIAGIGFKLENHIHVKTRRQRNGQNRHLRVGHESVLLYRKGGRP